MGTGGFENEARTHTTPSGGSAFSSPETGLLSEIQEGKVCFLPNIICTFLLLIARIDLTVLAYLMKTLNEVYQSHGLAIWMLSGAGPWRHDGGVAARKGARA